MMKKVVLILAVCLLSMPLFAGGKKDNGNKAAKAAAATETPSAEMVALQTAYSLARYGYGTDSASALIGAAEIIAMVPTREFDATVEKKSGAANPEAKEERPEFTVVNLLADARRLARGDRTMLAWASEVESKGTRDAEGGPRSGRDTVDANGVNRYQITFVGGLLAQVYVCGDGDTDLDLYVYDQNGNLIVYDEYADDECLVQWIPTRTGPFIIEIINLGRVYNKYSIMTN